VEIAGTADGARRPGAAMRRIDYDTEQYQDYARGRALAEQQLQAWVSAFGAVLPERRPLAGLDIGSGTGRFTPRWRVRSGR
jgi:tRNA G46 methylase TrmB